MATAPELEKLIRPLTLPINGQFPRPWSTDLNDPSSAKVFLIGRNWGVPFLMQDVGSHNRFIDAMFNRNGESCKRLYDKITNHVPTRTKRVYSRLQEVFAAREIDKIIETNVICYGTRGNAKVLNQQEHRGGRERGISIFRAVLEAIRPPVLICHGTAAASDFAKILGCNVSGPQREFHEPVPFRLPVAGYRPAVFIIPALAAPEYNKWCRWSERYFQSLANAVRAEL